MARPKSEQPTKEWSDIFIAELTRVPNVTAAAKKAKRSRAYVYRARAEYPDFAAAWDDALEASIEHAEGELYRRSVNGVLEPVFYQGEMIGHIRRYSDTLLMFLLRSHKPERYMEKVRSELTGANGGPIEQRNLPDLSKLSVEELEQLERLMERASGDTDS
jgi:hypothetical protein